MTERQRAALISQRLTSPPDQSREDAGKLGGGGRDVCSSRGEQDCFWRLSAAHPFSSTRGHPTSSPLLLLLTQHLQKPGISAPTAPPPSPSCFPSTDRVHALAARPCPLVSRRGYFSPAVLLMRAFGCLPQPARLQQAQLLLERLRYHRHHGARVPMHVHPSPLLPSWAAATFFFSLHPRYIHLLFGEKDCRGSDARLAHGALLLAPPRAAADGFVPIPGLCTTHSNRYYLAKKGS